MSLTRLGYLVTLVALTFVTACSTSQPPPNDPATSTQNREADTTQRADNPDEDEAGASADLAKCDEVDRTEVANQITTEVLALSDEYSPLTELSRSDVETDEQGMPIAINFHRHVEWKADDCEAGRKCRAKPVFGPKGVVLDMRIYGPQTPRVAVAHMETKVGPVDVGFHIQGEDEATTDAIRADLEAIIEKAKKTYRCRD